MNELIATGGAVKSMGHGAFEGFGISFTGGKLMPESVDCDNEWFHNETTLEDLELEGRKTVPNLFSHGTDKEIGREIVARSTFELQKGGLFIRGQLTRNKWRSQIQTLLDDGVMAFSSAAVGHMTRKTDIGGATRIDYWPVGEISFTTSACSLGLTPARVVKDFQCLTLKESLRRRSMSAAQLEMEALRDHSELLRASAHKTIGKGCKCQGGDLDFCGGDGQWLNRQREKFTNYVADLPERRERREVQLTAAQARERLATATALLDQVMELQETGKGKEFTAQQLFKLQTMMTKTEAMLRDAAAAKRAAEGLMKRELRDYVLYTA